MTNPHYTYIILRDRHVEQRIDVICENDNEAKCRAEQLLDSHAIEIWQDARWVITLRPGTETVPLGNSPTRRRPEPPWEGGIVEASASAPKVALVSSDQR